MSRYCNGGCLLAGGGWLAQDGGWSRERRLPGSRSSRAAGGQAKERGEYETFVL